MLQLCSERQGLGEAASQSPVHPPIAGAHHLRSPLSRSSAPLSIQGALTENDKPGGLYTTEIYHSRFWRQEIQGQGANMVE